MAAVEVLAQGPWEPAAVRTRWRAERYEPEAGASAAADAALAALAARGSPSHDSLAARVAGVHAEATGLTLELQPVRWALRLVAGGAAASLFVLCLVRDGAGRWLAGHRSPWLAILPGVWHVGAAGSVAAGDDPVATMRAELDEEWGLKPPELTVAALLAQPSGQNLLLGLATVPDGAELRLNDEHDAWAWWPADPAGWPAEAAPDLRDLALWTAALPARDAA
jgi:hypothetical protein